MGESLARSRRLVFVELRTIKASVETFQLHVRSFSHIDGGTTFLTF